MNLSLRNPFIFGLLLILFALLIESNFLVLMVTIMFGLIYAYQFQEKFSNDFLIKSIGMFIVGQLTIFIIKNLILWSWTPRGEFSIATAMQQFFPNFIVYILYNGVASLLLLSLGLYIALLFGNGLYFELKKQNYIK